MQGTGDLSAASHERLVSLDLFRGFAIAGMFLVNNPGSYDAVYPPLAHAEWNGWTFADTIFPFFLFIVGVATAISFHRKRHIVGDRKLTWQIIRRSVSIIGLGMLMHMVSHYHISTMRIPGTLQRIGICYGIAAFISMRASIKGQIYWVVGLLASYWLMMEFIPVPGIGAGVYEPGRNFAAYIDSFILSGHMWPGHPTWDPEGVISTLPAIATTLFGVLAGRWLVTERSQTSKTIWLTGAGVVLLLVGAILNQWLPINKSLWTSSYSIFMAGMACCGLGPLYWIVDVKGYKRLGGPFVTMGINAITLYVLAGALNTLLTLTLSTGNKASFTLKEFVFQKFLYYLSPINASLLYACSFLLIIYAIALIMQKMKWHVAL